MVARGNLFPVTSHHAFLRETHLGERVAERVRGVRGDDEGVVALKSKLQKGSEMVRKTVSRLGNDRRCGATTSPTRRTAAQPVSPVEDILRLHIQHYRRVGLRLSLLVCPCRESRI